VTQVTEPVEITRVNIREVWPGEARDFTPWMADHVEILGEHLEIGELSIEATEVPIPGGRNLDVLAVDADGARWAIENQYGVGDHDHFTRGLAYAVALECRALVIVAEDHREEFIAVADEWNRYSEAYGEDGIRVFLAVIEAWQIGDSAPGFRFRSLARPNEWKVLARSSASKSAAQADRNDANHEFWSELLPVLNERSGLFRSITARTGPFIDIATGPFRHQIWVKADSCHVQLRIDSGDADENDGLFEELEASRAAIEEQFGDTMSWNKSENHRACIVRYDVADSVGWKTPSDERKEGIDKVVEAMVKFHAALDPVVGGLS
jgi:hypothetical protein